jgi:translation initiation factor 3 subunit G
MIAKSDDKTLVVSHITYAIKEDAELLELFQPFGEVSSATLRSALGGRFAFVTFVNKEDAEKAMNTLNDGDPRGWDKRVLKVDWASNLKKLT